MICRETRPSNRVRHRGHSSNSNNGWPRRRRRRRHRNRHRHRHRRLDCPRQEPIATLPNTDDGWKSSKSDGADRRVDPEPTHQYSPHKIVSETIVGITKEHSIRTTENRHRWWTRHRNTDRGRGKKQREPSPTNQQFLLSTIPPSPRAERWTRQQFTTASTQQTAATFRAHQCVKYLLLASTKQRANNEQTPKTIPSFSID
mmetsp:Transcript_29245/g.62659  ORF Transcript_29245/g.62659 Transcript_29245/m.62659 type:complete len:201 (-) Transcript_29245:748-1350(-)